MGWLQSCQNTCIQKKNWSTHKMFAFHSCNSGFWGCAGFNAQRRTAFHVGYNNCSSELKWNTFMGGFPQEVNSETEISIQIIRQCFKIICLWKGRDVAAGLGRGWRARPFTSESISHWMWITPKEGVNFSEEALSAKAISGGGVTAEGCLPAVLLAVRVLGPTFQKEDQGTRAVHQRVRHSLLPSSSSYRENSER